MSGLDDGLQFSQAGSCAEALTLLRDGGIDLVLLDLHMPDTSGLGSLQTLQHAGVTEPIVVLSGESAPDLIRSAIEQGASGFVPKSSSSEILVAALGLILAGGIYLPPAALNGVADVVAQESAKGDAGQAELLSERQSAVLLRAIKGQSNKVIAIELDIAEGTVKSHLSSAFKALGVHNRTEAVFAAAKLGLTPQTMFLPGHNV